MRSNKINIFIIIIAVALTMLSCFDDEGNYDYIELQDPVFGYNGWTYAVGYLGDSLKLEGKFYFPQKDSIELTERAEFEWWVEDYLISTEKDLAVATDDVYNQMGIKVFQNSYNGAFVIKDKVTGSKSYYPVSFYIRPKFFIGNFLILSEDGANSKLSYHRGKKKRGDDGEAFYEYTLHESIFKEANDGQILQGKPIRLIDHRDDAISTSTGATTVLTEQSCYVLDNATMEISYNLKDAFVNGTPNDFKPVDGFYTNNYSFIVNHDGKLFYREKGSNYLGGRYLTTPLSFDNKGYEASVVCRAHKYTSTKLVYDKKNRRMIGTDNNKKISLMVKQPGEHILDLTNLPEDIEVLALYCKMKDTEVQWLPWGQDLGIMLYKQGEEVFVHEFRTNINPGVKLLSANASNYKMAGQFDNNTQFIIMCEGSNSHKFAFRIFYTNGNQIRYFDRITKEDKLFYECTDNVSAIQFYTVYYEQYKQMAVGLENGDFFLLDVTKDTPIIIEGSKFNVGGKVVEISNEGSYDAD